MYILTLHHTHTTQKKYSWSIFQSKTTSKSVAIINFSGTVVYGSELASAYAKCVKLSFGFVSVEYVTYAYAAESVQF